MQRSGEGSLRLRSMSWQSWPCDNGQEKGLGEGGGILFSRY